MQITTQPQFKTTPLGEQVLPEINRGTFDQIDSGSQYLKRHGERLDKEEYLFIVLGTDSGLFPEWVVKRGIPRSSRFLFIEIPEVIECIRERLGGLIDSKQVSLCTTEDWLKYGSKLHLDEYLYKNRVDVKNSFVVLDKHHPGYLELQETFLSEWRAYKHRMRAELENELYIQTQLCNAADNLWPLQQLKNAFKGWDAVLLGGGPSLDSLLPWIIDNRERLLVIAVSRISRQLLAMGLHPDIVVSIDPQPISYDISKEMLQFPEETLFISSFHAAPQLLGQWHGQAFFCGDKYPWETPLNEANLPVNGPTVTNTALMAAVYLGCRKVILAGVDLCFSQEGHTHAAGSNEREKAPRTSAHIQVETNQGTMADTSPDLALALQLMGEQAALGRNVNCEIINPSLTAAKIDNVDYRPVTDIVLAESRPGPLEAIRDLVQAHDRPRRLKTLKLTGQELARANGNLRKIIDLTSEALACNERLRAGPSPQHNKRMEKIERTLDNKLGSFSSAIKKFAAPQFLSLSRPDKERAWTEDEMLEWGKAYYQTYLDAAQRLLEFVAQGQTKVRVRLEELAEQPDVEAILTAWQQDGTPGRALPWLEHPEDHPAAADIRDRLEALREEFESVLAERNTGHSRLQDLHAEMNLAHTVNRLHVLYRKRDIEEMTRVAEKLQQIDKPMATQLHDLAQGYIADLQGDLDAAYGHYNKVVDSAAAQMDGEGMAEDTRILENALKQMSVISLGKGDAENALAALDVLAALSPLFVPQYAELLGLAGRLQDAVDVYTRYLEEHPGDLMSMLKLGRLFQKAGVNESARWACEYVLDKDPGNATALNMLKTLSE